MDDRRLERIELKIDDAKEHLASIDSTLSAQHVSLIEHMRRTAILESELKPIKKHVDMVNGAFKLIGVLTALSALYEVLSRII